MWRGGGGGGCEVSAKEFSSAHGWSPNKHWRSNAIFNLCLELSIKQDLTLPIHFFDFLKAHVAERWRI
jgi:hypothetical protein